LGQLDAEDSRLVYEAIRVARPGGLGSAPEHDVGGPPPERLLDAMRLAAERDLVARQYANNFGEVLGFVAPELVGRLSAGWRLSDSIVYTYLRLMSQYPDSLIARKCGEAIARQAADRAAEVLRQGEPGDEAYQRALAELDFWLRSDRHRRNPGTSADLVAAGLFVALREGVVKAPWVW
jgi:triphosphoribosyl-dephospho-CoA synthase